MTLEEKLHRIAGWAGLLTGLLGLAAFASSVAGVDWLRAFRFESPPLKPNAALCLMLAGASLWLQRKPSLGNAGAVIAAVALTIAALTAGENLFNLNLGLDGLILRDRLSESGPFPGRMSLHNSLALALIAAAVLGLRQRHKRKLWPISSWLANLAIALAIVALIALALHDATGATRPLRLSTLVAVALLLLGAGTLLARPEDRPVQILFAHDATGVLGRRLFLAVAVMPTFFCALLVVLVRLDLVAFSDGVLILPLALVLSGFLIALFSVDTAATLESTRHYNEQARELLTARLQEQAAQLQDTVGARTRELHEANTSLRAAADSHARLALVAHHTTNGVVIADAEGRVEWVNTAFERQSGYTLAELRGRRPADILAGPNTEPAALAQLHAATVTGTPCNIEILYTTKQGQPFWQAINLEPVRDHAGRLINFIAIQIDISERRSATAQLHELNERLRLATRSAALGVWEWDALTQKSTWDDRTFEIYGLPRAGYEGTAEEWKDRIHPGDRERALRAFDAVVAGANEFELEFRIVRANDEAVRHIQSRAIVQRDGNGRLLRITGTERDVTDEREAVVQMQALNDRLRLALQSSRFGVWELDAETNRLTCDERMFELYGLDPATFDGQRDVWRDRVHPDDRAGVFELSRQVFAGELPAYDTEFRILHPDGSVRYVEAHAYLQRDAAGRTVRFVGLNRDITAEREVHEALTLAEQRWQLALEGSNDSVWDWDLETGVLFHDVRWAQMLGYAPEEIEPSIDGWRRLAHPEDLSANEKILLDHFTQRTPLYQHELRMKAKNGEWKWILERGKVVRRAADGRPLRMAGTHSDITTRRLLENRLRQAEELSDQVSRVALIGGWEYDLETSRFTWSAGMRRIHEVGADFAPTIDSALAFYPPESQDLIRAAMNEARLHDTPIDLEVSLTTARDRAIWVRVLGAADLVNGKAVRLHGAMQDVTAQHESEQARRALELQLFQAQKMETLGTLAGGIAHDFNNVLTGIIGFHELAADSVPEDHPARASLAEARNASLRARELVEQILTFGRQPGGFEHAPLDLALVLEEARRFLRATLPANITIELELAPRCGRVRADATQIHQVLLNLGSNGAHAMRQRGGTLRIKAAPAGLGADDVMLPSDLVDGPYVKISVADSGHGMDENTRRRIFDPFFTTKNTREGTGLGLAVVHGIVRAHRGTIDVESVAGRGSTFHVYLPAADDTDDANPIAAQAPLPRGEGELIWIVDDEEIVGNCTKLVLENKGYRAAVFRSAEQCLTALTECPQACAALITDQTMPGMQGTDLIVSMRRFRPELPVIIMSGYFSKIPPATLDELGRLELLAKPFTSDELTHAVQRSLHPEVDKNSGAV